MFLYADTSVCPRCRATLPAAASRCSACRAALDDTTAYDVFRALQQVDRLVTTLRTLPAEAPVAVPTPTPALPVPTLPVPTPPATPSATPTTAPPAYHRPAEVPRVMSGLSVPKILLGLGALCLLVAALVFLLVAWASLGVGGRTAVLLGFTAVAAGLAAWSARAGLRAGAEALTTVGFGLLAVDLAGANSAGWLGDLSARGFFFLTGTVLAVIGTLVVVLARRTPEPRLLSAEITASIGLVVAVTTLGDLGIPSASVWLLLVCAIGAAATLIGWKLRLGIATWTAVGVAVVGWAGLTLVGLVRAIDSGSWTAYATDGGVWPLATAALIAAAPSAVRRLPRAARVVTAGTGLLLATAVLAIPSLGDSEVSTAVTLIVVVAAHALAGWFLPRPWSMVTTGVLALAGAVLALMAAAIGAVCASSLLDHGLWDGAATARVSTEGDVDLIWTLLLPASALAAVAAGVVLLRFTVMPLPRLALTAAAAIVSGAVALVPVIAGVPVLVAVLVLLVAVIALGAWSLLRLDPVTAAAAAVLLAIAFGAALVDDGLTIGVLALAAATTLAAELRRTPTWLPVAATWLLPPVLAATTWAVASAADLDGSWRAAPVIAALTALALLRPGAGHEAAGLGTALLAVAIAAGYPDVDHRLVAAELAALGLVATLVAIRRTSDVAALTGLALLVLGSLTAWPDSLTAVVVLTLTTAVAGLHDVRRMDPAAVTSRILLPATGGALLWALADLAGLDGGWQGLPVALAAGALLVWKADPVREIPAAAVAALAAVLAVEGVSADGGDVQAWTAAYLTLGGVALTTSALLHRDRRLLAWGGLALFTLAQWLRLEQLGVGTVEAYTLPLAVILLVVGTLALRDGDRSTLRTQGAGLGLALVPSLLQVLAEPVVLRAALLGAACVVCIAVGVLRRWAAPLLAGGGTLAVLVLRQMTIAQELPQWALIGIAGILLTFVGLTWEKRLANVRTAADYVRDLR